MENIFWTLMLFLFGGVGLISVIILINLLFAGQIIQVSAVFEGSLGRSLLIGFINILFVGMVDGLIIWLAQSLKQPIINGILGMLVILLTIVPVGLIFLGLASLANLVGHRMGKGKDEFDGNLRGGMLLILAGITPFIGWFAFTPITLMTGLGAAIQFVFRRKEKAA